MYDINLFGEIFLKSFIAGSILLHIPDFLFMTPKSSFYNGHVAHVRNVVDGSLVSVRRIYVCILVEYLIHSSFVFFLPTGSYNL